MAKPTSIEYFRDTLKTVRNPEKLSPIYLLYGDESFFIDLIQDEILNLVPREQRDFNLDLLYGREVTLEKVLSIAKSYPMMAEKRVLVVRDYRYLDSHTGQSSLDELIPYINQPNPSTVLLLIDKKGPDKRTKFGQSIYGKKRSKHVYVQEFEKLPDYKLPDWVIDWVAFKFEKQIDPGAARILSQLVGNDLQLLSTEIEKVCTFVDTNEKLSEADIKKIVGSYREFSVFELKEAVIDRNLEKSLTIVEQMLLKNNTDAGEVFRTVGFFYSVFGNIWKIRRLAEKGMDKSRIQQQMDISNSWYFNQLWNDASNFRLYEMPAIFEALLDADRAAKGFSTLNTSTILLLMVKRIVG